MKKLLTNLFGAIGSALKIKQKNQAWKMSEDGKEYHEKKKENEFYDALEKGDTKKADAMRKDKQNKINKLKNLSIIIICVIISGCKSFNYQPEDLTEAALTTTERTYEINNKQPVKTSEGTILFDDNWVIVHKDFIKQYNENQNDLLNSLKNQKKLKLQKEICFYLLGVAFAVTLLAMVKKKFTKK